MKRRLLDDSLWFYHQDGGRFYPWLRHSNHHGSTSFFVSEGSNHIADAIPVATVQELLAEVFIRGRSIWLFDGGKRTGLYRVGQRALVGWGGSPEVVDHARRLGAPAPSP